MLKLFPISIQIFSQRLFVFRSIHRDFTLLKLEILFWILHHFALSTRGVEAPLLSICFSRETQETKSVTQFYPMICICALDFDYTIVGSVHHTRYPFLKISLFLLIRIKFCIEHISFSAALSHMILLRNMQDKYLCRLSNDFCPKVD